MNTVLNDEVLLHDRIYLNALFLSLHSEYSFDESIKDVRFLLPNHDDFIRFAIDEHTRGKQYHAVLILNFSHSNQIIIAPRVLLKIDDISRTYMYVI